MKLRIALVFLASSLLLVTGSAVAFGGEEVSCGHNKCATIEAGSTADGTSSTSAGDALNDAINNLNPNHCTSCLGLGCIEIVLNNEFYSWVGEYDDGVYTVTITAEEGLEICTVCTICILPLF